MLKPERAGTLFPAVRGAVPDTPIEAHAHNTTGLAPQNYIAGLKAGIDILHTAARPMANGPSLPSTEGMIDILESLGLSHRLDVSRLAPVAENFPRAAAERAMRPADPTSTSLGIYDHQLPGGMTGTLKNQLAQHGMSHRLAEVLRGDPAGPGTTSASRSWPRRSLSSSAFRQCSTS